MNDFLAAIEKMPFSQDLDEFDTKECIICIEPFVVGQLVHRIPTCRHIFHPNCCNEWFKAKVSQDEQRCPQCNSLL